MKRFKTLSAIALAVLLFILTGCTFLLPYTKMDGGRLFPKPPKYTIMPDANSFQDVGDIDYDAIYSERYTWSHEGSIYTNYFHVRFWPAGECLRIASRHECLTKDFCESFKTNSAGWSMGFYNLKNGEIAFEIYAGGAYNRSFGRVSKEGIHVSRTELQYARANFKYEDQVCEFYQRQHLGLMKEQPDWSPTGVLHRVFNEKPNH